ncbi:MAG TPA: TonB-dependent receptor [Bryobacteraceae bacterium]|nr:TonB-dependent receptor [Bryobacteraceae bacterium]
MRRLAFVLLGVAALISAQEFRGAFSGSVTDAQGSAVPKAKITVTETRTNTKSTAISEGTGEYTIPFLAPGIYDISAEAPGFKTYIQHGMTLSAGEHPVVDIHLEVGATNESVTVTAESPILVTSSPSLGQVITTAEVEDIPINGRTPMMLDNLALGVVSTYEPGPVRPFDNGAPNSISIGGVPATRNEVLLDGAPNAGQSNQMAYSPMADAVTEVRVQAFDMDASSGHTMGGTVNVVTRSGTNGLHGTAYIYNQTSAVDANTFFNNRNNVPRPPYHQNQYGATAGGPVLLPKLYNGRNKVFWFFGWEAMRDSDPADSPLETGNPEDYTAVPTAAERQGDFSALLHLATNPVTIYDPNTGVLSGNLVSRTPFPNNIIPTNRLDPVALAYLKYFPQPNSNTLSNGQQNYRIVATDSDGYDNELGRMDVSISDKNRLSFEARHNYRAQNKNNFFDNPATGNFLYRINQGAILDDVYTITPTTVLDMRLSWTRYIENHSSPADTVDPASLGFPGYIDSVAESKMLPYITFLSTSVSAGARQSFEPLGYNGDGNNFSDIFQAFGEVTKIHGNHTLKIGGDAREYRWSAYTFGNPSGTYGFNGSWTNDPAVSNTTIFGQDLAQFLLGIPSSGSLDLNTQNTVQNKFIGLFVNDDWRVKSNLTLNLGLRFDHDFPETERYNRSVNGFDANAVNPVTFPAMAAYQANPNPNLPAGLFRAFGGLTYPTSDNRAIYHTKSHIISPRFGFAWTPHVLDNKTVLRGGIGVLVDPIELPSPNQEGFSQQTTAPIPSTAIGNIATLSNPFPNGFLAPSGSSNGAGTFLGNNITFFNPNIINPYTIRWELSMQRQLPAQMVLEVAYIGSHTMHEPVNTNLNYISRNYLSTSLARDNATINLLTGAVTNPFKGLIPSVSAFNASTIALDQLLVPFPEFPINGVTEQNNPVGSGYYESLNVRLQKRYGNGLILINNFIWNRMEDTLAYLNPSDPRPEKRISSDSRPLRNVMAVTYQLPIGRGRKLNLQSRWLDSLVGGWQASGVFTLQSGPVIGWGNYIYYGGPLHLQPHQPNGLAFDTSQFNIISTQQLANNIQTLDLQFNNLRRDYTNELDLSMDKNFRFTEKRYVQIRFEAFNLQNRVTFGPPNTTPTSTAFGTIGNQANTPRRLETAIRLVF